MTMWMNRVPAPKPLGLDAVRGCVNSEWVHLPFRAKSVLEVR